MENTAESRCGTLFAVENSVEIVDNKLYNSQKRCKTQFSRLSVICGKKLRLFQVFVNIPTVFHKEYLLFCKKSFTIKMISKTFFPKEDDPWKKRSLLR